MAKSKHRVGKKVVEVERDFHPAHLAAGYDRIVWGAHSHPKHPLLGDHDGVLVEHVEGDDSPTGGPEFKLTFPDGSAVTVLCEDVVKEYLT